MFIKIVSSIGFSVILSTVVWSEDYYDGDYDKENIPPHRSTSDDYDKKLPTKNINYVKHIKQTHKTANTKPLKEIKLKFLELYKKKQ